MQEPARRIALLALLLALASGCQMGGGYGALLGDRSEEPAGEPVPEEWYLDAGIVQFEGKVDEEQVAEGEVFRQVRKAETLYFPQQLRQAMLRGGGWRHVWVVPERAVPDLRIEGTVLESNGSELELEIRAYDATGAKWVDRIYQHEFSETDYAGEDRARPMDALFDRIAKDLLLERDRKGVAAMKEIRAVAELRFAKEFAPQAFKRHVTVDDGRVRLVSLPAKEDTLYQLVLQIKERDDLFIETLQEYSENFAEALDAPYRDWARQSFYERRAHDENVTASVAQGLLSALAIIGGVVIAADSGSTPEARQLGQVLVGAGAYGAYDAYQDYEASEIHEAALKELGQSLDLEVEPQVVQVENQTRTLTGSVEDQYQQWHEILNEIYLSERGGLN